jgi:hypothetical protein
MRVWRHNIYIDDGVTIQYGVVKPYVSRCFGTGHRSLAAMSMRNFEEFICVWSGLWGQVGEATQNVVVVVVNA